MVKVITMAKIFQYYGAKTHVLPDIKKAIKPIESKITCFVDVFGGSGTVVLNILEHDGHQRRFGTDTIQGVEDRKWQLVYNDIDKSLYKTFRAVADDTKRARLLEKLEYAFHDRAIFEEYKQRYKDGDMPEDDVECAFMIIYLYQNGFNGSLTSFGVNINDASREQDKMGTSIKGIIELFYKPLDDAALKMLKDSHYGIDTLYGKLRDHFTVENLDWKELIKKWDSKTTLFYLDPPYLTGKHHYKHGAFTVDTFKEMKQILDSIQGYYLMNESDKDFDELIPIFGEPQQKVRYANQGGRNFVGATTSYRIEGFWSNFAKANDFRDNYATDQAVAEDIAVAYQKAIDTEQQLINAEAAALRLRSVIEPQPKAAITVALQPQPTATAMPNSGTSPSSTNPPITSDTRF